jgi:hypothetical protein
MGDATVWAFIDGMTLKAKDLFEPLNSGLSVAVAMTGNKGAVEIRHGESSVPIMPLIFLRAIGYSVRYAFAHGRFTIGANHGHRVRSGSEERGEVVGLQAGL